MSSCLSCGGPMEHSLYHKTQGICGGCEHEHEQIDAEDREEPDDGPVPKRPRPLEPEVAIPVSVEEALVFIGENPYVNFLVCGPGTRNIAGGCVHFELNATLKPAERGTLSHVAGREFGENAGMVNDFVTSAINGAQLQPLLHTVLVAAFGPGYGFASERCHSRNASTTADTTPAGRKKLDATVHTDYGPHGEPTTRKNWKCPGKAGEVVVRTIVIEEGSIAIVVLNQAAAHGVARGGTTEGCFISAVSRSDQDAYKEAFMARAAREFALKERTDKVYVWPELACFNGYFEALILACLVFGLPPPVFASKLPFDAPQSYAGAIYPSFTGMAPDPLRQTVCPDTEIAALKTTPGFAPFVYVFTAIKDALPGHLWVMSPLQLTPAYLNRLLFR